jgi:TatD DNase family protein
MLVDSHCHLDRLDLTKYDGKLALALDAAKQADVGHILCVCIDKDNAAAVAKIANDHRNISASVGVHPTETAEGDLTLPELITQASQPCIVAIGETGLDYYRSSGDLTWQQERFRRHIRAAKEVGKPLIVHTRDAREDTIRILREERAEEVGGVLHCFTENWVMAEQAISMNFYISFSGIITFQNAAELRTVAQQVPLNRILIETDAPYLAPMPYRGKPNEPAYVHYVATTLAALRNIHYDEIAAQTTENFFTLFKTAIKTNHTEGFL